jgi:hypothetical protein
MPPAVVRSRIILALAFALAACGDEADPGLAGRLQAMLSERLGVQARVGSAEVDLVDRQVTARDVELRSGDGAPLLVARSLVLGTQLAGAELSLDEVELRGVEIELRLGDDGLPELPPAWRAGGAAGGTGSLGRVVIADASVRVKGEGRGAELTVEHAELEPDDRGRSFALRNVRGRITLGGRSFDLRRLRTRGSFGGGALALEGLRAEGAGAQLELDGRRDGDGGVHGEATLRWEHPTWDGQKLADGLQLRLRARGQAIALEGTVALGEAEVAASGRVHLDAARTVELQLQPEGLPAGDVLRRLKVALPGVQGRLSGRVSLQGTLAPPELRGHAELQLREASLGAGTAFRAPALQLSGPLRVTHTGVQAGAIAVRAPEGATLGELMLTSAAATVEPEGDGALSLRDVSLSGDGLLGEADSLRIAFGSEHTTVQGALELRQIALPVLLRLFGIGDGGLLSGLDARARGALSLGDGMALELKLEAARAFGLGFEGGRLRARRAAGSDALELQELSLQRGPGQLRFDGRVHADGRRELAVALRALPLAGVAGLSGGAVSGEGSLGGSRATPAARLALRLKGVVAGAQRLGDARIDAALGGSAGAAVSADRCPRARAALKRGGLGRAWLICGEGLGGRLSLDLALGAGEARALRGRVRMRELDWTAFLPPPLDAGRSRARASFEARFTGGGLGPGPGPSGQVVLQQLTLTQGALELASAQPVTAPLARGTLTLPALRLEGERSGLTLSGTLWGDGGAALKGEGHVAADLLAGLSPWVDRAEGEVDVEMAIEGPPSAVRLSGALRARDVLLTLDPTGAPVRAVQGAVRFDAQAIEVESLHGELGGGSVQLKGRAAVGATGIGEYAFTLQARGVELEPQPRFSLAFDADVKIAAAGDATLPLFSGEVRLRELLYARHVQMPEAFTAINRAARQRLAAYDPADDRFRLDLRVVDAGELRVRNDMLDAEVRAPEPLRVVGTDQRFGLLGTVQVPVGERVLFQGDEFSLTRGELRFEDRRRVSVQFDVAGEAPARKRAGARIVFEAVGDGQRFELSVRCVTRSGDDRGVPERFRCRFRNDALQCDTFDTLVTLWVCEPPG